MKIENTDQKRRASVMGGIFYPESAEGATQALETYLSASDSHTEDDAQAILAPHGSWEISGLISGAAFAAAQKRRPAQVVLLGPIHDGNEDGIFLTDSTSFETPLGDLDVAEDLIDELESCGTIFERNDIPHLYEHSLEILLPFVKYCFPTVKIVPILVGGYRPSVISSLSRALDVVFDSRLEETLFVLSSNLSEHPSGETKPNQSETFLSLLLERKEELIIPSLVRKEISACGASAVAALLSCRLASRWVPRVRASLCLDEGSGEPQRRYAALSFK
jgi:hypothetical protein